MYWIQELDICIHIRKLETNEKLKAGTEPEESFVGSFGISYQLSEKNYYVCSTHYKLMHATRRHPFKMRCNSRKTTRRESTCISAFSLPIFYNLCCLLLDSSKMMSGS